MLGFDCGPANALLDGWCQRHRGQPFDADGALGRQRPGRSRRCCSALLAEPYFALPPPKSTGRDLFNLAWLDAQLAHVAGLAPADVQATLAAAHRRVASRATSNADAPATTELFVCGGGAFNARPDARAWRARCRACG